MRIFKNITLVFLGVLVAVCIFCLVIGIACSVNGLHFGEQISQWFGSGATPVKASVSNFLNAIITSPIL